MKIRHQGWNETVGMFDCDVTIDESRRDYEIHFLNGTVFRQQTPFHHLIPERDQADPVFGAFFLQNGLREFFTPLELASLALNGFAVIPGLQIEEHQENLVDRIQAATKRTNRLTELQSNDPSHKFGSPAR